MFVFINWHSYSQTIATFTSVAPGIQSDYLVLPTTHTFQRIIKSGDLLDDGSALGSNLDFTAYVPISGSSLDGYLFINSETTPARMAAMNLEFNATTKLWEKSAGSNISFSTGAVSDLGAVSRFCSGTVTPDNTIIIGEEGVSPGDVNNDGYEDIGWLLEIDPVTKTVMDKDPSHNGVDKLWAAGRHVHENVAISTNKSVMYWGADNTTTGYMYKFVPATAGDYTSGLLYVLEPGTPIGNNAGPWTGTWKLVANTTQAERNNTIAGSNTVLTDPDSDSNFDGIEDVEINPYDGKIYFAAKSLGRIYRFTDNGNSVSDLEVFVEKTTYDIDPGPGVTNAYWGDGNDNLAFDGEGNLWVLQDGANNHIWVVGAGHTMADPQVRLFARTPAGCEPTGITFTPDYKYLFLSFQHPSVSNTASQPDASGTPVIFDTHTTVVISRVENLGLLNALPVIFTEFSAMPAEEAIFLKWQVNEVAGNSFFVVERSQDGNVFLEISRINGLQSMPGEGSFNFTDEPSSSLTTYYYRIRMCNRDGACVYSKTISVRHNRHPNVALFPNPARDLLRLTYQSTSAKTIRIMIINPSGKIISRQIRKINTGNNAFDIDIRQLSKGSYTIFIGGQKLEFRERFVKL